MTVGIYTLGCKVNTYESEFITSELKKNGFTIKSFEDICDIYIINTCTVTNTGDVKSRKAIRQARTRNNSACIVALGCYVQANINNMNDTLEDVDILIGNKDKSRVVEYINKYFEDKKKQKTLYDDLGTTFEDMFIENFENRTRAFVKIQDGCENFCSYCIIPFTRGKCRSKKMDTVLQEINCLVKNGYSEVVLTGIHTGNYGVDINTSFASLLKEIVKIEGLKRLRISSIEITELSDEVLDIIKTNDIIVNHMHIPIQAASNKVLEVMNRKYNIDYFIEKIDQIKSIKEDISITTDIIVGHPYEDDDTFNDSIDTLRRIGFSKLHVFPYSKRDNTKSSLMEQVDDKVKKERVKTLLVLSKELEQDYMNKFLNKTLEVLIEVNKDGYSIGHTTNYLQVKIEGEVSTHTFVNVLITEINYPYCIGKIVE